MTDLSAEYKTGHLPPHPWVRFVTAASLFDGRRGHINIMRHSAKHGCEVIAHLEQPQRR
jgi:hypothetical protein